jgi:hypothetical protein
MDGPANLRRNLFMQEDSSVSIDLWHLYRTTIYSTIIDVGRKEFQ